MSKQTIIIEITPSEDGFRAQSFGQEPRVVGLGDTPLESLENLVTDWRRARRLNPKFMPGITKTATFAKILPGGSELPGAGAGGGNHE